MGERFLGIDLGAESLKIVELTRIGADCRWTGRWLVEHHKSPGPALTEALAVCGWDSIRSAAATGRFARCLKLSRLPVPKAQARAFRFLWGSRPATLVSIGSRGFSVLELRKDDLDVYRENSRCSQGTGNFLRQLVERFGISVEEASALAAREEKPAPLSGRCPVILKTDMTHLANKGESHPRILAGLFDAVAENVQALVKPRLAPNFLVLIGGVSRAPRLREHFGRFISRFGGEVATERGDELFYEALGAALVAAEDPHKIPALGQLWSPPDPVRLERLPALHRCLGDVRRHEPRQQQPAPGGASRRLLLGLDIGSTGSKLVALDLERNEPVFETYRRTGGDPVGAAQGLVRDFLGGPVGGQPVVGCGVTGSGREIVGSLLKVAFGGEPVFILNEIAAHAAGALHFDPRVDTIFEIGGQDAKYIRLDQGRVVDAAMNEACSAGTGSFIEEQGKRLAGRPGVEELGRAALAAEHGVSLGQHCSVFMAEVIDAAIAAGESNGAIVAGIYDSVIQNYLNRVKGSRSVGEVIFCQGMPFSAPALAAAVARRTGRPVIVPPSPGTTGALGIALLAGRELALAGAPALELRRFLGAEVISKESFVCASVKGCGGSGNRCRIDRLTTRVEGEQGRFTWGGACSLYDRGAGRRKLPDGAPDPFRWREEQIAQILAPLTVRRGRKTVALTGEFVLKGMLPFFVAFFHELGFDPVVVERAGQEELKRGIEEANVPYCAPLQIFSGVVNELKGRDVDFLFLPMLRNVIPVADEEFSVTCPIAQASPDLLGSALPPGGAQVIKPVIDFGAEGLVSELFKDSCRVIARQVGARHPFDRAFDAAAAVQRTFDDDCLAAGAQALEFCRREGVIPVVVLGRSYTIHNTVLNSNVPAILREQGALPIPVDCFPVGAETPVFKEIYWGYGQRILRAAHTIRRTPGVYGLFCSNYSCGPDSFNIHFFNFLMAGKPFAIIETDGHSGDAGTKTRVEAFLYCVREDLSQAPMRLPSAPPAELDLPATTVREMVRERRIVLMPRLGPSTAAMAACLRGLGLVIEELPVPTMEDLEAGRRYTSGKECLPLTLTLGQMLNRVEQGPLEERLACLMPTAHGPCRFGVYHLLQKTVLARLGLTEKIKIWSPGDRNYFEEAGSGFAALAFTGIVAFDQLNQALFDTRPLERQPGAARKVYQQFSAELLDLLDRRVKRKIGAWAVVEAASGRLFGCAELLRRAGKAFAAVRAPGLLPTVLVVGEIYVRSDPFSNDSIIDQLEARGCRVHFSPIGEWFEYTSNNNLERLGGWRPLDRLSNGLQHRIADHCHDQIGKSLGWPSRTSAGDAVNASGPWIRSALAGEAVLTLGAAVHDWRQGHIDGVVNVGPLECMPTKIAEAQFFHAAEEEGVLSLSLSFNGEPVDPEILDRFVYEVQQRFRRRHPAAVQVPGLRGRRVWSLAPEATNRI